MPNLQAIKARRGKITQGKWTYEPTLFDEYAFVCREDGYALFETSGGNHDDLIFCANAPTDIDWLVQEVERLREALKAIDETLTIEINPNNYNESNVLELNNQAIEISAIVSGALQEHPNDHD